MSFEPGQDVVVTFSGEDCCGEVVEQHHGWVLARVQIDPLIDFGDITSRLDPHSLVMRRESEVRLADA